KAYAKADQSRELDDVHAWRRAARTLRYQLELMSSRADLPMAAGLGEAHAVFKSMVKELGQVTDLIAMRGLIDEARESVVGVDLKPLSRALSDFIASRLERVFAEAALTFSLKPRDFLALESEAEAPRTDEDEDEQAEAPKTDEGKAEQAEAPKPADGEVARAEQTEAPKTEQAPAEATPNAT
ncbi:MAG TPA: CHAD domain-containing protein, partial [Myxococcota bacterium]|nr:CHAD domain-containing protein [Myxococcota bacterium]